MEGFKTRPNASRGLWCTFLIPVALLCNTFHNKENYFHIITLVISWGLLFSTFFKTNGPKIISSHLFHFVVTVLSCLVLSKWIHYDIYVLFVLISFVILLFHWLCMTLLAKCPGSFTLGEVVVVSQGTILFIGNCFLTFYKQLCDLKPGTNMENLSECSKFIQVLIIGCCFLMLIFYILDQRKNVLFVYVTFIFVALITFMGWIYYLQTNPITWLFQTSFKTMKRVYLMMFWVALTFASVLFVTFQGQSKTTTSLTTTRKYFHIIVMLVYFPGILYDPELLYLASAVALAVFLVLEMFRIMNVPPIGSFIENAYQVFLDEKDVGILILTHIYLLIGCSCPLWLSPPSNDSLCIGHLSGVISVGVGDTFAAIIGSKYGKHRWKGTKKTMEGTISAILAQLFVLLPLLAYSQKWNVQNVILAVSATILTSLVEAKTSQVDNLILPLFMLPFLFLIY